MKKFEGVIPAFATPLTDGLTLNEKGTRDLVELHLSQNTDGFYIGGATGEGLVLAPKERERLAQVVVDQVKGKVPVISHIAAIDLSTTVALAKQAEEAGCDCVASIPPIYFSYDEEDIFNYYKAICDSVSIPVMIYYHPAARTIMTPVFMKKLFDTTNVQSVKWSYSSYFEMLQLKDITNGEMNILNGPDETLLCGLAVGADGGIGTSYNFLLPQVKALYQAFKENRLEDARKWQMDVSRIIGVLLSYPVIPATKVVLRHMGFDVGEAVYPMKRLSSASQEKLIHELKEAGFSF